MIPLWLDIEYARRFWLTATVIAVNVAAFVWTLTLSEEYLEYVYLSYGFTPDEMTPISVLTCMFLHGGWLHIIGNMIFLWVFGFSLEQELPRLVWLVLYLVGGAAAAFAHALFVPEGFGDIPAVGASGAISALLGASVIIFPRAPVLCLYLTGGVAYGLFFTVPTGLVLGGWFIMQLVYSSASGAVLSVAFWAHVGGFIFGALFAAAILQLRLTRKKGPDELLPEPVRALRRAYAGGKYAACVSAWLKGRAEGVAFSASDLADVVRALSKMKRGQEAPAVLFDYLRGEGGNVGEDRLLLEAGRSLKPSSPGTAESLLQALIESHPSSPHRPEAQKLLGA